MARLASFLLKRRKGAFLLELMIVVFVVGVTAAIAIPELSRWQKERLLDAATDEVCALIRRVDGEARSGDKAKGNVPRWRQITFVEKNGRVYYCTYIGPNSTEPRGWLPKGIVLAPTTVILQFDENGFPDKTKNYTFIVKLSDNSHARYVTVAMYTGRIRTEDAW